MTFKEAELRRLCRFEMALLPAETIQGLEQAKDLFDRGIFDLEDFKARKKIILEIARSDEAPPAPADPGDEDAAAPPAPEDPDDEDAASPATRPRQDVAPPPRLTGLPRDVLRHALAFLDQRSLFVNVARVEKRLAGLARRTSALPAHQLELALVLENLIDRPTSSPNNWEDWEYDYDFDRYQEKESFPHIVKWFHQHWSKFVPPPTTLRFRGHDRIRGAVRLMDGKYKAPLSSVTTLDLSVPQDTSMASRTVTTNFVIAMTRLCPNLTALNLDYVSRNLSDLFLRADALSLYGAPRLAKSCPQLRALSMKGMAHTNGCRRWFMVNGRNIADFKNLTRLELDGVDFEGYDSRLLERCRGLVDVSLRGAKYQGEPLTDALVVAFVRANPTLTRLVWPAGRVTHHAAGRRWGEV